MVAASKFLHDNHIIIYYYILTFIFPGKSKREIESLSEGIQAKTAAA